VEALIRLGTASSIFLLMIVWEFFNPKRHQQLSRKQRWPVNLGLAALNMLIMRLTIGGLAYLTAVSAAEHNFGLLHWLQMPEWASIAVSLLFLDLAVYCQHIVMHKWSVLWRLHQVHHTDIEFDATTAVRFHPLEIVISMLYKIICVYLLGAALVAVIAFEMILNGAATFNHSNIEIPAKIDQKLRWLLITPDMHRIHHSTIPLETDSNYGFSISCWDRLFKTYTAEPKLSQTTMLIGISSIREATQLGFLHLLLLPFGSKRS
jgi:sterol desaturase/sphingolipid hydroxylase (fatty acid hydroxylase superfamily)